MTHVHILSGREKIAWQREATHTCQAPPPDCHLSMELWLMPRCNWLILQPITLWLFVFLFVLFWFPLLFCCSSLQMNRQLPLLGLFFFLPGSAVNFILFFLALWRNRLEFNVQPHLDQWQVFGIKTRPMSLCELEKKSPAHACALLIKCAKRKWAYICRPLTCVPAKVIDCVRASVSVLRLISLTAGKCCLTAPLAASHSWTNATYRPEAPAAGRFALIRCWSILASVPNTEQA